MLVKMAEAIGRLVLAGRELTRLAGLVYKMFHTISLTISTLHNLTSWKLDLWDYLNNKLYSV